MTASPFLTRILPGPSTRVGRAGLARNRVLTSPRRAHGGDGEARGPWQLPGVLLQKAWALLWPLWPLEASAPTLGQAGGGVLTGVTGLHNQSLQIT